MTDHPRLFPAPAHEPLLLVVAPQADGCWLVSVRRGPNPLTDEQPTEYDHLCAAEASDVVGAVVWEHLGL